MNRHKALLYLSSAFIGLHCATIATIVCAQSAEKDVSKFISGPGTAIYGISGVVLPVLTDGKKGKEHALRITDSLATSLILCAALQQLTDEKRPDSNARDSFPSCHATGAFAVAAAESKMHPKFAPLWLAGAGLIAYSRVDLHRHHIGDVVAGAVLGAGTSFLELRLRHGYILRPFISSDDDGKRVVGLEIHGSL